MGVMINVETMNGTDGLKWANNELTTSRRAVRDHECSEKDTKPGLVDSGLLVLGRYPNRS